MRKVAIPKRHWYCHHLLISQVFCFDFILYIVAPWEVERNATSEEHLNHTARTATFVILCFLCFCCVPYPHWSARRKKHKFPLFLCTPFLYCLLMECLHALNHTYPVWCFLRFETVLPFNTFRSLHIIAVQSRIMRVFYGHVWIMQIILTYSAWFHWYQFLEWLSF